MACRPRISRMLCAIWFALSRRDMNWPIRLDGSEQHESSRNVRMAEIIDDNLCHPHVSGEFAWAKRKLSTDQEAEKHAGALTGRSGYPSSTVFTRLLKAKKAGGDTPDPDQVSGGATTGWECTAPLTGAKPLGAQTSR